MGKKFNDFKQRPSLSPFFSKCWLVNQPAPLLNIFTIDSGSYISLIGLHGGETMDTKKKLVGLRLTEAEHARLREAAAKLNCTHSELLVASVALVGVSELTEAIFLRALADARLHLKHPILA